MLLATTPGYGCDQFDRHGVRARISFEKTARYNGDEDLRKLANTWLDLQSQYSNYKNTLQSLAQKVGEIEQEIEEHKSVMQSGILKAS